jgi:hypothetical protein
MMMLEARHEAMQLVNEVEDYRNASRTCVSALPKSSMTTIDCDLRHNLKQTNFCRQPQDPLTIQDPSLNIDCDFLALPMKAVY